MIPHWTEYPQRKDKDIDIAVNELIALSLNQANQDDKNGSHQLLILLELRGWTYNRPFGWRIVPPGDDYFFNRWNI